MRPPLDLLRRPLPGALTTHPPNRRPLAGLADLRDLEVDILRVINQTERGPALFLADPFRFLEEHGFRVEAPLQQRLRALAPRLRSLRAEDYQAWAEGRLSLPPNVRLRIGTLGTSAIPDEGGDR